MGRGEKELLVVAEIGSRGSGSSGKRFVGGYPIGKSSRSDGSERCGVVAGLGSRLYAVPLRGILGVTKKMKSGDLGIKLGAM